VSRGVLLGAGAAILAIVWTPWFEHAFGHGFAAHMARHMGLVAVAAPLIALGLAGGRFDPSRAAPALFPAIPVSLVELAVVWGWHAPAPHVLAREGGGAFVAEQASFLLAGLWLWLACFGGRADRRPARSAQGALAMLLTAIHMTLLGVLLAAGARPLFGGHDGHLAAIADQQLGGVLMLAVGGLVYLAGGVALVARLLNGGAAREGRAS
jgi:putative membrane protein